MIEFECNGVQVTMKGDEDKISTLKSILYHSGYKCVFKAEKPAKRAPAEKAK